MVVREIMLPRVVSGLLAVLLLGALSSPVHAQQRRVGDAFYGKLGGGISDYTGDFPAGQTTHPFDFQEFRRGSGLPYVVVGEIGYQFTPRWALALGIQAGNYPIVGYAGMGGISDSYRYAPQLLGRYTFVGGTVAPYVDVGVNATFGGDSPPTSVGFGPSVGGGVDIQMSRTVSFYVESRFNATLPDDAVDGAGTGDIFDLTGQLLGFGLKVTFTSPVPPRIVQLDRPAEVTAGTPVTFGATINEEADRPLDYQWDFGDGNVESGLTATHTYDQPGTYEVSFSASNEAGEASRSITVTARRPPTPAQITSARAAPNPVGVGAPVQFRSAAAGSGSLAYEWSFGDGESAQEASPTHIYTSRGEYTARLRVSNEAGTDTQTVTVRVARRARQKTNQKGTDQKQAEKEGEQWGIVVASMGTENAAKTVVRRYRDRVPERTPIDIVAATTDQGLRYRVVVGTFEDADAARQALKDHKETLPSGAWILRFE